MNKQEYKYCNSQFRELLGKLEENQFQLRVKYRYALRWNPLFGFYHLWDGGGTEGSSPTTLATIKLRPESVVIRLLPKFTMRDKLLEFTLPDRKSIFIESSNVTRHDSWVEQRVQSRVHRRILEHANAQGFNSRARVQAQPIFEQSYEQFREGVMTSAYAYRTYDQEAQMIYGRPAEQVQRALRDISGQATTGLGLSYTEHDIHQAVAALDEMNVPRETGYNWDAAAIRRIT